MSVDFEKKEHYHIQDLLEIVKVLRSENGCPWDKEQTHESIRQNFIEEVYEVCEAIDQSNDELMKEELGDVLFQVVFHAQMCEEEKKFAFDDVVDGICKKMIVRHPHIFSDVVANTSEDVLRNWDAIKQKQKGQSAADTLVSVPSTLPALMRSQKIGQRAARAKFDYTDSLEALGDLEKEIAELKAAIQNGDSSNIEEELGDVLFSAVNVSRLCGTDAEYALTRSCEKFIRRFARMQKMVQDAGKEVPELSMDVLNDYWAQVKSEEKE